MKLLTAFLILVGTNAFAMHTSVQGNDARIMYNIFNSVGAYTDCGMGKCGTTAQTVYCVRYSQGDACELKVQTETGEMSDKKTLSKESASRLTRLLIGARVVRCGRQGCDGVAKEVSCTFPSRSGVQPAMYRCEVEY